MKTYVYVTAILFLFQIYTCTDCPSLTIFGYVVHWIIIYIMRTYSVFVYA